MFAQFQASPEEVIVMRPEKMKIKYFKKHMRKIYFSKRTR